MIKEQKTRLTLQEHDDDDDDDDDINSYGLKTMITEGGAQLWAAPLGKCVYISGTYKRHFSQASRPNLGFNSLVTAQQNTQI